MSDSKQANQISLLTIEPAGNSTKPWCEGPHLSVATRDAPRSFTKLCLDPVRSTKKFLAQFFALLLMKKYFCLALGLVIAICLQASSSFLFLSQLNPGLNSPPSSSKGADWSGHTLTGWKGFSFEFFKMDLWKFRLEGSISGAKQNCSGHLWWILELQVEEEQSCGNSVTVGSWLLLVVGIPTKMTPSECLWFVVKFPCREFLRTV